MLHGCNSKASCTQETPKMSMYSKITGYRLMVTRMTSVLSWFSCV